MNINWSEVFVILLVLVVIGFIFLTYRLYINGKPRTNTILDNVLDKVDTGDIFLVRYDSVYGKIVRVFAGTYWSHAGIILRTKKHIYILEVARYTKKNKKALNIYTIDEWLQYNSNRYIGYLQYRYERPTPTQIFNLYKKFKDIKVNLNTVYWLNTLVKWSYKYENKQKYFCTELIVKILQDLGMIEKKYMPCSYTPKSLSEMKEYENLKIFFS